MSRQEVGSTMQEAGWPPHLIPTMIGVAGAESERYTGADTRKSGTDPNSTHETSMGILQVNYKVHKDLVHSMGYTQNDLYDPLINAKVALRVYQMQGLGAWTTYASGRYRDFL